MIPKTIHYCWFGRNLKPKLAEKCIKSWKEHCKGYEIIEWNEDNFDISSAPLYVRQAYDAKKWAFVTDYVRLYAMVNYGGIYMDTDVEVIKPLDAFLKHKAFSGFENNTQITTGIMACEKDFALFKEFLRYYNSAKFIKDDGSIDYTTNVVTITNICSDNGFIANGKFQIISDYALYPKDYFCPLTSDTKELNTTENTTAIHWFSGSWRSKKDKRKSIITHLPNLFLKKLIGAKNYEKLKNLIKGINKN